MTRTLVIAALLFGVASTPALAACPPPVAGDTAAEIRANEQRLVCLQTELAARTQQRALQLQLDQINQSIRTLEMQRRLDNLPSPPVFVPVDP